jgi:para-nitrobenzyl esterase
MPKSAARPPSRMRAAFFIAVAVVALLAAGGNKSAPGAAAAGPGPVVRTASGLVQGRATGTADEYLGIPYAAPPAGALHDEWRLFVAMARLRGGPPVTAANYQAMIAATLNVPAAAAAGVAAEYPLSGYSSPSVALGAVGTDAIFACPALAAEDWLSRYTPTYGYEFNDEGAPERHLPPAGFPYGAAHETEVQYLFALRGAPRPGSLTSARQQLAQVMRRYWTTLATTGSPGAGWPRFTQAGGRLLSLVPPGPVTEADYGAEHHCAFWTATG